MRRAGAKIFPRARPERISERAHHSGRWPMRAELVDGIIHRLSFQIIHTAASHGVVKHFRVLAPRPRSLVASDVVQDRSKTILAIPRTADHRPKWLRNGCAIDDRALRRQPPDSIRIRVSHIIQQMHSSSIRIESQIDGIAARSNVAVGVGGGCDAHAVNNRKASTWGNFMPIVILRGSKRLQEKEQSAALIRKFSARLDCPGKEVHVMRARNFDRTELREMRREPLRVE
jgi:hypothetical protein